LTSQSAETSEFISQIYKERNMLRQVTAETGQFLFHFAFCIWKTQ